VLFSCIVSVLGEDLMFGGKQEALSGVVEVVSSSSMGTATGNSSVSLAEAGVTAQTSSGSHRSLGESVSFSKLACDSSVKAITPIQAGDGGAVLVVRDGSVQLLRPSAS
jgi:hypothetical protein